ncbi:ABC-three component system middle component 2 [Enterococcus sp. AZ072]|uniref:ABC-three component system middle component 2 n=1 Tax=unclassified Enterococcus TaxID=2608891 RepID=UPI003D2A3549
MKEIIKGITFQEYYLTIIRLSIFLDSLGLEHKKNTSENRLVLYDFYLKYPELTSQDNPKFDFDTKYSYFHWKPNYKLYSAVLADLLGRGLITYSDASKCYYITDAGRVFVSELNTTYIETVTELSKYVIKNICKLSEKAIVSDIDKTLLKKRSSLI